MNAKSKKGETLEICSLASYVLYIDAHRGGGGGGRGRGALHVPPQKTLKNFNIKMQ